MPLRLRVTGEGLRLTGPSRNPRSVPFLPQGQPVLLTENSEPLVTERGERLAAEPSHGQ